MKHAENFELSHVVNTPNRVVVIRRALKMAHAIVTYYRHIHNKYKSSYEKTLVGLFTGVEYARESSDAKTSKADDASKAKEVNIGRNISPIVERLEYIRGFVVASDEYGGNRRPRNAIEVLVEAVHSAVLLRNGHRCEVFLGTNTLKVSTNEKKINILPSDGVVDHIEFAMTASLHSNTNR